MQAGDEPPKNLEKVTDRFSVNRQRSFGKGCYGQVYEGYDHQKSRLIAIKHLITPEDFEDEIETLQKLSTLVHPNIMGFYGYKVDTNDVYFFLEYCPGGDLTSLINKGLSEEEVLDLFRQLVEGMCYMNAKSRIHRDLKPDNILIGRNKDIKISDFGLARENDGLNVTGVVGTPLYAGPEVYVNYIDSYTQNCDVWGAGLILYEMLMKKHPFEGVNTMADLKNEWKKYQRGEKRIDYPPQLHPQWSFITNLMLTFNPKSRPTFHEILEILKKVDDRGNMRKEIRNKVAPTNMLPAELYLDFIDKKLQLLVELEQKIENFRWMKESAKLAFIFMAAARNYCKLKKLIRSLKFKTIRYPNEKQVFDGKDPKIPLIVDNYRMIFEGKFTKCQNYMEEKIVPEIVKISNRDDQMNILKTMGQAYNLIMEANDGTYDIEDTYEEEYLNCLNLARLKPSDETVRSFSGEEQEAYLHILYPGFLDSEFPDTEFMKKDSVKMKLNKYTKSNQKELVGHILKLRECLK